MILANYLTDLNYSIGLIKISDDNDLLDNFAHILPIELYNELIKTDNAIPTCYQQNKYLRKLIYSNLDLEVICPIPFRQIDLTYISQNNSIQTKGETIDNRNLRFRLPY